MDRNKKGKSTKPHFLGSGELIALGKNTRTGTSSEASSSESRKTTSSSSSSAVTGSKSLASSSKLFTGGKFYGLMTPQYQCNSLKVFERK